MNQFADILRTQLRINEKQTGCGISKARKRHTHIYPQPHRLYKSIGERKKTLFKNAINICSFVIHIQEVSVYKLDQLFIFLNCLFLFQSQ